MEGIDEILTEAGLEHALTGVPAMFSFVLGLSQPPREYRDLQAMDAEHYKALQTGMRARGVEYERDAKEPWFVCEALSEADVEATLAALAEAVKEA